MVVLYPLGIHFRSKHKGETKKPTWQNTLRRSTTSVYFSTSIPALLNCPLSSHPTANISSFTGRLALLGTVEHHYTERNRYTNGIAPENSRNQTPREFADVSSLHPNARNTRSSHASCTPSPRDANNGGPAESRMVRSFEVRTKGVNGFGSNPTSAIDASCRKSEILGYPDMKNNLVLGWTTRRRRAHSIFQLQVAASGLGRRQMNHPNKTINHMMHSLEWVNSSTSFLPTP